MYGIPLDLDLNLIIGNELQVLWMGRYMVGFYFNHPEAPKISVSSSITLIENNEVIGVWDEERNWSSLAFQRLLNNEPISYTVKNTGLLEICFENGITMQLHDNERYEAIFIDYPNQPPDVYPQLII